MKNNKNAKKEITRNQYIKIRVSEKEKELWNKYAEDLEINPSRLARNILISNAESIINKYYGNYWVKGYIKTLKLLKDKEALERLQSE